MKTQDASQPGSLAAPSGSGCPECDQALVHPRGGDSYCENCGWPDDSRAKSTVTYKQLKAALALCKWQIQSDGGDPPPEYDPDNSAAADACWNQGMDQMGTALLNWFDGHCATQNSELNER